MVYYVAHRLFALHDRALGALVASELAQRVGEDNVFLPFCDTDQETLAAQDKTRTLFELDTERLQRLAGIIAIVHGPSLDDGVCMEIGYACRLGVPVILLTTDFQSYGLREDGVDLHFPDPLLETLATDIVRVTRMDEAEYAEVDRFEAFRRRNVGPLRRAARTAVDKLLSQPPAAARGRPAGSAARIAFLEQSPYQPAERADAIALQLENRDWKVYTSCRLRATGRRREDLYAQSRADWDELGRAALLIVDVNGPETPPGAALLIGAAAADGRPILAAYEGRSFTFAPEPNFRNLMIQYAAAGRFRTMEELQQLLD